MKTDFKHIFIKGDADLPVLLLLHGTGGDEHDLVDLGQSLSPGSPILSVRGKVLENGMPRFFRRHAEGIFDLEDLAFRTTELADFIEEAKNEYSINNQPLIALGYSNGANIAASVLLSRPESLNGAVLLRAMLSYTPDNLPNLNGKSILIQAGLMDHIIPKEKADALSEILKKSGAQVEFNIKTASHNLTQSDFSDIKLWLNQLINKVS